MKKTKIKVSNSKFGVSIFFSLFYLISSSQDLEPRAYANVPKNMNAIAAVYGYSHGNVIFDPSLPIDDFTITSHNLGLGYVRTFGLANKLARVQVTVPFIFMNGQLVASNGAVTTGSRTGFADTRIRFGINLLGSPALERKNFKQYEQKTILGVSLVTSIPTGRYYEDKKINIGANRCAFKPEIGISRRFDHIYAEVYMGVWFYTKNNEFLNTKVLEQKPAFSLQSHISYYFKNQMWIGVNLNWFDGGETIINNIPSSVTVNNWRVGGTWSTPITKSQSLKLQFHAGAVTNNGLNYNAIMLGYQNVFF